MSELSESRLLSPWSLPLFELTRSRKTKKFAHGDIDLRMEQIREVSRGRSFILDLTAHEDLTNPQIDRLLDDSGGFLNWRNFLERYEDMNIIPAIHTYLDGFEGNLAVEVGGLAEKYDLMAFRINAEVDPLPFLRVIAATLGGLSKVLLIVDAEYVDEKSFSAKSDLVRRRLEDIGQGGFGQVQVVIMSSSFPSSVTQREGGGDDYGELIQYESMLFQNSRLASGRLIYGDYASIHPVRYQTRGGAWVPRIDVSLGGSYIYTRYRREDGGYIRAAEEMLGLDEYSIPDCWSADQIDAAASGAPNGRSPSFWISARLNCHVSRVIDSESR